MMTKATKALVARVQALESAVYMLKHPIEDTLRCPINLTQKVIRWRPRDRSCPDSYDSDTWFMRVQDAAVKGVAAMAAGTRVRYVGEFYGGGSYPQGTWHGTVVPRPFPYGVYAGAGMTGEAFVWVVRDGEAQPRGCYGSRLVRL